MDGKYLISRHTCINARRCVYRQLKFFFSILFMILSGLRILSDAILPTARSSYCFIMMGFSDMGFGYICVVMMSEMFVSDNDESVGRRTLLNWLTFSSLIIIIPFNIEIYYCIDFEFIYFFMMYINFSSTVSMNFLQILYFTFLIFWLYSFRFFFHSIQFILLYILSYIFLARFSFFLNLVNSSFHHLLLNGDDFFRDMISIIILLITFVRSLTNSLIVSSVVSIFLSGRRGRYFCILFLWIFQFILMKLYDDCVNVVSLGARLRMISIERWSEMWLFSMIIWHFIMLFIAYSFSHIRSIAIFSSGNMIMSNEIINCMSYWSISAINSSAYRSCLWYYDEFHNE